jgi:acyl-CoA reductase-like NAD-dependent aldehyde dehydrogenase
MPDREGAAMTAQLAVEDPATGEVIARVPLTDPSGLAAKVDAAAAAFPGWARLSVAERADLLRACGARIEQHHAELSALLTREQGKPLRQAEGEVALAAEWFARTAELSLAPESLGTGVVLERLPHGVIAAIAPANFPIILSVTKIAPALLAGNTVLLKPSPLTPLSSLRMGELLAEVLPPDVFAVVTGGGEVGTALAGHPDVRMVSFTGSVPTGRAIATRAAAAFKRIVLELGGNDAAVVLPGADIDHVAGELYRAAMVNSGQFCAAVKRVYVAEEHRAELVEALAELARTTVVGPGSDPTTDLGPLVSATQRHHVVDLVDAARAAGGRVVTGGRRPTGSGYFYPPTVVTDLPPDTRLESQEQFGPVIPVLGYDTVAEAVDRANSTEFGLGGSVWGEPREAAAVAARLDCGTAWINAHGDLRHDVPFGGTRSSGVGVEYGYWGLLEYTRIRVTNARG